MRRYQPIVAVALVVACSPVDPEVEAYRLVVADLAREVSPLDFCLSPTLWYDFDTDLPATVQAALVADGHEFFPMEEVPDTSTRILTLSGIRIDSISWGITADLGQIYHTGRRHGWAGRDWDYRIMCDGGTCQIIERFGPGHSTGGVGTERAATLTNGGGFKCPTDEQPRAF